MFTNSILLTFTKGYSCKSVIFCTLYCFLPTVFRPLILGLRSRRFYESNLRLRKPLSSGTVISCIEGFSSPRPSPKPMSSKNMSTSNNLSLSEEVAIGEDLPNNEERRRKSRKRNLTDTYLCGVCKEPCKGRSVYCESCHVWYHGKCESIPPCSHLQLGSLLQEYCCTKCCQSSNGHYDFASAICRLTESAVIGQLEEGVKMEQILLRNESEFNVQQTSKKTKYQVDRTADQILRKYAPHITSFPVVIHGDGNCLFSALSVAVFGDATKAAELRVRITIEMVSNRAFYKRVHFRSGLLLVSPDFDEACVDCAQNRCYSSAWTIHAASSVLGRPIRSVYPPVNGLRDRCYQILDRTFAPRILMDSKDITVMWSGNMVVADKDVWIPNHFVPLVCTDANEPVVINSTIDQSELTYTAPPSVPQKQLNKIRPKKVEKFRNDTRYAETSSYFKDGLRCVEPYSYTFECHIKGRWYGRKVLEVCKKEFRSEAEDFYEKAIAVGLLTINGERVSHDRILHNNELLRSRVHRHEPPVSGEPIKIIHSDDDVVVVNKPASIPVHPCGKYRHNTLVFILGKEYGFTGLHTIHRLDRLTSGLLIFARTTEVSKKLDTYVRNRDLEKTYLSKVKGQFPSDPVICEEPIIVVSHKIGVCRVSPQGKTCRTRFQRLSYDGETSIVECVPHTGRMHQIRVHLQHLGYPITNDPLYNNTVWGSELGKGDSTSLMSDDVLIQKLIVQHDEDLLERVVEDHRQSCPQSSAEDEPTVENLLKRHDRGTDEIQEGEGRDEDLLPSTKKLKYDETVEEVDYDDTTSDKEIKEIKNPGGINSESESAIENVEKSSTSSVGGSECLTDGALSVDKLLPPDVLMRRDGETEEERLNRLVMMFCQDCKIKYRNPKESEMRIYLHALRYKGPDFDYSTEMPSWAQEHLDRCQEKID